MARDDEQLETTVIGGPTVHDDTIVLVDHDPAWATLYAREAERISTALGPAALRVEHAGSTAVPALAAKPIIDIVLAVADPADEAARRRFGGDHQRRAASSRFVRSYRSRSVVLDVLPPTPKAEVVAEIMARAEAGS